MNNRIRISPLAGHILLATLERRDVERVLLAAAETARDVTEAPRIHLLGDDGIAFGLVLATGPGTVYDSGKRVEPSVKVGDVVLVKSGAAKLELPFRAKELVAALSLPEYLHGAKTCMMHEALFEAVVTS